MKKLVLVICFAEFAFAMARSFNEKITPYPKLVQMQRPRSSNVISLLQAKQNEKIKRILHLMHLMDPNCLKKFHNEIRYNRRPFGMVKPFRMPAFRNDGANHFDQISYYNKMNQNQLKEFQDRRHFGNDRIIFVPPNVKLMEKRVNASQNKNSASESFRNFSTEEQKNLKKMRGEISVNKHFRPKEENRKYIQSYPLDGGTRKFEDQMGMENSTVLVELENIQMAAGLRKGQVPRFPQRVNNKTSSTHSESPSRYFWPQTRPIKIQPYEVEEIIEEELSVNLNDEQKENFKNFQFGEPSLLGKDVKKMTNSEGGQKMHIFHDVIDSSINTVLKTLMAPMAKAVPSIEDNREFFSKEGFHNSPSHGSYFTPTPRGRTSTEHNFPIFRGTANDRRPSNRPEQSKQLKISNSQINEKFFNLMQKSTEQTTVSEFIYNNILTSTPVSQTEYQKKIYLVTNTTDNNAEILYTPMRDATENERVLSTENLKQNEKSATNPEIPLSSPEPELNKQSSITTHPTLKTPLNEFTTQQTSLQPSKSSDFSSELPTTLTEVSPEVQETTTEKSTVANLSEDSTRISAEEIRKLFSEQTLKTEEDSSVFTFNEAELSTPDFQEFTDHPMTFDLLTTMKSDLKKNSRKMHFGQEHSETTSNHIPEVESTGPRRSDILISDNFDDYVDVDNNLSTLSYLDKLKQGNSFPFFNLSMNSSESAIPLIPAIITDLREGKISPEDISILSEAFSKYWSAIMALSNVTNLDMLPLLKMKTEEDLKRVLESFLTENTEVTTIKTTETYTSEGNEYDYIEEYNDFYQYVLGSEQEKETKRKKLRPKRNGEDISKASAIREYFESVQEKQAPTNNYSCDERIHTKMVTGRR